MKAKKVRAQEPGLPRPVKGYLPRRLTAEPAPSWMLMAVPFLAVAVLAALFMSGRIGSAPRDATAMSMLLVLLYAFGASGIWLMAAGLLAGVRHLQRRERQRLDPKEPWRWDRPWRKRISDRLQRRAWGELVFPLVCLVLLAPFHVIFGFKSGIILMDLMCVAFLGRALFFIVRHERLGGAALELDRVPYFLGEVCEVALVPSASLVREGPLTATLRCIEERSTFHGEGEDTVMTVQEYALHSIAVPVDVREWQEGKPLRLRFALPGGPERLGTCLTQAHPCFWELVLEEPRRKVPLAVFPVPVYAKPPGGLADAGPPVR
jgi:hypothetical protein